MLNLLKDYKGELEINGTIYDNIDAAIRDLKGYDDEITIVLNKKLISSDQKPETGKERFSPVYRIKVRQYMTKPSTADFDFQDKWNKGVPMPLRIMVGRKLKETRGMVQMELWGEITQEITTHCMACGRPLTNPVSKFFGIGPECGGHGYTNPFDSDEELKAAVDQMHEKLKQIRWTGWIIKSAIEEEVYLEDREF